MKRIIKEENMMFWKVILLASAMIFGTTGFAAIIITESFTITFIFVCTWLLTYWRWLELEFKIDRSK